MNPSPTLNNNGRNDDSPVTTIVRRGGVDPRPNEGPNLLGVIRCAHRTARVAHVLDKILQLLAGGGGQA